MSMYIRLALSMAAATGWLMTQAIAAGGVALDLAPGPEFTLSRELEAKATDTYRFTLDGKANISFVFAELGKPACMMEVVQLPINYPLFRFDPHQQKTFDLHLQGDYQLVVYQTMSAVKQKTKCAYDIKIHSRRQ